MEYIPLLSFALFVIFNGMKQAKKLKKDCNDYRAGKYATHFKKNFSHHN